MRRQPFIDLWLANESAKLIELQEQRAVYFRRTRLENFKTPSGNLDRSPFGLFQQFGLLEICFGPVDIATGETLDTEWMKKLRAR